MSTHASFFRSAAGSLHERFFSTSVAVEQAGVTVHTPATLGNARATVRTVNGSTMKAIARTIRLTQLATLRDDATITIDGEAWSVEGTQPLESGGISVSLVRHLATEPARAGYRR